MVIASALTSQIFGLGSSMNVIVLRGISGAGKSTWAAKHYPDAVIASADSYFLQEDGSYDYDPKQIDAAHEACYQTFVQALINREPLIVVDNSNVTVWEISPYVMPARSFGYEVEVLTLDCDPEVAIRRKDWLTPERVRTKAKILLEEEKRFPDFIETIHRKIKNDQENTAQ